MKCIEFNGESLFQQLTFQSQTINLLTQECLEVYKIIILDMD